MRVLQVRQEVLWSEASCDSEYNNCCWSVQLVHQNYLTDDQTLETRVLFQIQLKGLGGTGGASAKLSEAIDGFDERERRRFGTP